MFGSSFILSVMSVMRPAFMKSGIKMRPIESMSGTSPAAAAVANFRHHLRARNDRKLDLVVVACIPGVNDLSGHSSPWLRAHMLRVVAAVAGADAAIISDAAKQLAKCLMVFLRRFPPPDAMPLEKQNTKRSSPESRSTTYTD